jgi:hypothetical protein
LVRAGFNAAFVLAMGTMAAFVLVALFHDLVSEHAVSDNFGEKSGVIAFGVIVVACVGLFVLLAQSGAMRIRTSVVAFAAGFFTGFGAMLMFGLEFQPLAVSALAVAAFMVFVSFLRWIATRR